MNFNDIKNYWPYDPDSTAKMGDAYPSTLMPMVGYPYPTNDFPYNATTFINLTGPCACFSSLKIEKVANGFLVKDGSAQYVFETMESLTKFLSEHLTRK